MPRGRLPLPALQAGDSPAALTLTPGGTIMTRGLMPWTGMASMRSELERWFDRLAELKWDELPALGEWAPSMDISENKDSLIVKVEVPGMDQKDIEISLQENLLTIKGEKKQEKEEKDERHHRVERSYGAFARSVRLPVAVDGSKVGATFKNGLLTVTLPKTPAAKGTQIPIKAE
jgi:HSP20 family protein